VGLVARTVDGQLVANQCGLVPPARLRAARDEGRPRGVLRLGARRLVTGGRSVRVELACHGRCDGVVTLRARDGLALAQRRISLRGPRAAPAPPEPRGPAPPRAPRPDPSAGDGPPRARAPSA
jgi:hypothetical protein